MEKYRITTPGVDREKVSKLTDEEKEIISDQVVIIDSEKVRLQKELRKIHQMESFIEMFKSEFKCDPKIEEVNDYLRRFNEGKITWWEFVKQRNDKVTTDSLLKK